MLILGIDTSCDDTGISVVKVPNLKSQIPDFEIISSAISSQVKLHAKYGGVYPFLAKREHLKNLPIVFKEATKGADVSAIDLIGVTVGPGLDPCLWTGINFAKELAGKLKKPLIPVNHIEAHILANWISLPGKVQNSFPVVCLVASGGHTQLILMKDFGLYKIIGETRDDAAGECFDKAARILGISYPGGPIVAELAELWQSAGKIKKYAINLPRPMMQQKNYDFSFSGLKTAVLYDFKKRSPRARKTKQYVQEMCFEIQQAIIDVLIKKTIKAVKNFRAKAVILGGGVAANDELQKQFQRRIDSLEFGVKFFALPKNLCTDNGTMIAVTAYFQWRSGKQLDSVGIEADSNLRV